MEQSLLRSKVNFYIGIVFVTSFGILATTTVLRAAQLDDPVSGTIAKTAGYNQALEEELSR